MKGYRHPKNPMKLALVTPRYPPTHAGGGEISARLLAEQLTERGIADVTVYSFDGESEEMVNGVTIRRLADVPQYPYTLPNEIAYRKLQSVNLSCELFHAYNMHLHPAVGRLSDDLGIPAVATLNAYPLLDWEGIGISPTLQRRLYEQTLLRVERPRLKRQMRNIDLFFPLSSAVEDVYRDHGFEECEFQVVPNMSDPGFEPPARSENESAEVRLLYVGYLRDSKGVRYLLDSMELLPSTFELTVVGGGPKLESLKQQAEQGDAADRIEFTGSVPYDSVTQAYAEADVFVHPGVWPEPFGRTILEAMQSGLPVVATNVGGPAETVPQPELRCKPADPGSLRDSIEYAAEHRKQIGTANERLVRKRYHPDAVIPQFCSAYQAVLDDTVEA